MAATPQQIAAAKQLAASRGYDPNLVDADNADRANTAFPGTGGNTGGTSTVSGGIPHTSIPGQNLDPGASASGAAGYSPLATPASTAPGAPGTDATTPATAGNVQSAALVGFQSALSDSQAGSTQPGGGQAYYSPINPRLGTRTAPALIGLRAAGIGY